ncbi:MAG: DNA-3-methyladenine glycosylase I, partial [Chloroflexi bacterium]|nr:DNA-3-methyladenine glycosylase I [Chloroflexota bacterium]
MSDIGMPGGPVVGEDGIARCPWTTGDPLNVAYHDTEWGLPVHGEGPLLERITMEAFQSGLSWLTILRKRPAFRSAFAGFDADRIAGYDDDDVARLMTDAGIVRNRAKIIATIQNARATVEIRVMGGLDALIWSHRPGAIEVPRSMREMHAQTPASVALAKDLRSHGFVFVGPTTAWALMQAIGLVDDHLVGCHRRGTSGVPPPDVMASHGRDDGVREPDDQVVRPDACPVHLT